MKPPKEDLQLKRLAREAYFNAIRLFEDAVALYERGSHPSAFFLALSSIEELGKVKMIDHFYADMRLNHEALGYSKETFIRALLTRKNFYSHSSKHSAARDGTMFYDDLDLPVEFSEVTEWLRVPQEERQKALYVDFRKNEISTPVDSISKKKSLQALKLTLNILEEMEDMGLSGTYWVSSVKTKRKARTVIETLRRALANMPV